MDAPFVWLWGPVGSGKLRWMRDRARSGHGFLIYSFCPRSEWLEYAGQQDVLVDATMNDVGREMSRIVNLKPQPKRIIFSSRSRMSCSLKRYFAGFYREVHIKDVATLTYIPRPRWDFRRFELNRYFQYWRNDTQRLVLTLCSTSIPVDRVRAAVCGFLRNSDGDNVAKREIRDMIVELSVAGDFQFEHNNFREWWLTT